MDIMRLIVWAALLQGFILSLTYIFSKKRRNLANTLLGLFILSILLIAIGSINPYSSIGGYDFSEYFALPNMLLLTPTLFLNFVLQKLGCTRKYQLFLRVNYFLATLVGLITLLNLYLFVFESSSISQSFQSNTIYWFHFGLSTFAFFIAASALFISWKEIHHYKTLVQNEFSDYDLLKVSWLLNLVYFLMPVLLLWGIALYRVVWVTGFSSDFDLPIFILLAVFLYYLSYQAYLHPNFFETLPESALKALYKKPAVDAHEIGNSREDGPSIENQMLEGEHFLDHDLTISAFAMKIEVSARKISTIINQDYNKNFNEWVNEFRVSKAKQLMENDIDHKYSLEGIGAKAGFKSRSAFYAAFKKGLGCTPGEFRKSLQ